MKEQKFIGNAPLDVRFRMRLIHMDESNEFVWRPVQELVK